VAIDFPADLTEPIYFFKAVIALAIRGRRPGRPTDRDKGSIANVPVILRGVMAFFCELKSKNESEAHATASAVPNATQPRPYPN
jgi:hypothetical protein